MQQPRDGDTADLLALVPAVRAGGLVGYARVSTKGQLLDRKSGKNAEREELWKTLDHLREGDTLVVPSLDRLGRSIQDLIAIVSGLRKRGIGFTSLHEALDITTPGGRLVFHVFAALAEFIRELIIQGANEGLDAARARGVRLGRPPAMTEEQVRHARDLLARPENTVTSIAKLLGVSRNTIYNQHHLQLRARTEGRRRPVQAGVTHAHVVSSEYASSSMIRMSRMNVAKRLPMDSWLCMPEIAERPQTSLNVGSVPFRLNRCTAVPCFLA
ncbi:recombinase family protein [Streptomyces scabichelini]|uniref:recombinase family protein n=1 Tax=Streptomyces scabichelini TaxID=2711217 RepID=UPI0030B9BB9D